MSPNRTCESSTTPIAAGAFALIAWVLRLGMIANFVSESVLVGFSAGAALVIASSQLPKAFGLEGTSGTFFERAWHVLTHLGEVHGWSIAIAVASIVVLVVLEERFDRLPAALFVVLGSIAAVRIAGLEDYGVHVAGMVPAGLPSPNVPLPPGEHLAGLVTLGFGVFLLSCVEGVGVARTISARNGHRIDPNQELLANGVANIGAGLFRGYAVGGSMSRSVVTEAAGAKTPAAGAVAAVVIGVVLLFLTGVFRSLPEATLAAIILVAVRRLIDLDAAKRLWRLDRTEFLAAVAAFAGVLLFGMLEGILIGVNVTFLMVLRQVSRPTVWQVGRRPGTRDFVALDRNAEALPEPGVLVLRSGAAWFYANASPIRDQVLAAANAESPSLVVIDLGNTSHLDLSTAGILREITEKLGTRGISVALANVHGAVGDAMERIHPDLEPVAHDQAIDEVIAAWQNAPAPTAKVHQ